MKLWNALEGGIHPHEYFGCYSQTAKYLQDFVRAGVFV